MSEASNDTKSRIMEAALETLRTEGIKGTSARSIARQGDFNQALIFYHFGSIIELLITAANADSAQRVKTYRTELEGITSLPELAAVARRLSKAEVDDPGISVVTQLLAGAAGNPEMGAKLWEGFEEWIEVVASALGGALEGTGFDAMLDVRDMAFAIVALFMGIELIGRLNPDRDPTEALYSMFDQLGGLLEGFLGPLRDVATD